MHRLKAKKKTIRTLDKNKEKTIIEISDNDKTPKIEIIKSAPAPGKQAVHPTQLLRKQAKAKNNGEVVITNGNIQHLKERRKLREKRLRCGNSAAVRELFGINPEKYLDKPLVFDLKATGEEEIFEWLISNISNVSPDNDTYYIEHEESSNMCRIRKDE